MTFSYSAIWDDTVRMIRGNATVLAALAGVFIFLPAVLMGHFLPLSLPMPQTLAQLIAAMEEHLRANWFWLLASNIVNMAGALAMLLLLFGKGGPTVGSAIMAAFAILPFYFLAWILSSMAISMGLVLFILPGAYLFGRTAVLAPVVAVENRRNPIDAILRSFEITRGNGWAIIGLILIIGITAFILTFVVTVIFGSVFIQAAGQQIGGLLALIVNSLCSAAFSTLIVILFAAIYRGLAGGNQP